MRKSAEGLALSTSDAGGYAYPMEIIEHPHWEAVRTALQSVVASHPEWFPNGYNGIYAVANRELFAAVNDGNIYLSDADALIGGFKPASVFASAVKLGGSGHGLSFHEEYAVEMVWHELMHGITGMRAINMPLGKDPLEEGVVQAVARLSYPRLLSALRGKAQHQQQILSDGLAYPVTTSNILYLLRAAGLHHDGIVESVINASTDWRDALVEPLSLALNIQPRRIRSLLAHAAEKAPQDFIEKLAVMQRNAPRNNLE